MDRLKCPGCGELILRELILPGDIEYCYLCGTIIPRNSSLVSKGGRPMYEVEQPKEPDFSSITQPPDEDDDIQHLQDQIDGLRVIVNRLKSTIMFLHGKTAERMLKE